MHTRTIALAVALLAASLFAACTPDGVTETRFQRLIVPVEVARADVQDSIRVEAPRTLCATGNIYALGHRLFVNEPGRGWHVFDNADVSAPELEAFWRIPGSTQLSFVNGYFVTDTYGDIVQLDFDGTELSMVRGVDNGLVAYYGQLPSEGMLITGLEEQWVEIEGDCADVNYGGFFCGVGRGMDPCDYAYAQEANFRAFSADASGSAAPSINVAGSLSRFGFGAEYLYVATEFGVYTFAVTADSLVRSEHVASGWELETAVAREGYLYCGAPDGMLIYDLAEAMAPQYLSRYTHVRGCDPVAVEGDRAVVTVRDGSNCGGTSVNQLSLLDISDRSNPRELRVYPMLHPHGVALYHGEVIVCEGAHGWKRGRLNEARNAIDFDERYDAPAIDVAVLPYDPESPTVFTVAPDGIRQYKRASVSGDFVQRSRVARQSCD